ncbi:MAG: peptidase [Burkholderiaceae bacterium]|nr:MAG: peptidase [Burkholderiaceae bacterium]
MNFFANQELARRQSRQLIWLFLLALICIVAAINGAAWLIYRFTYTGLPLPHYFFLTNTVVVVGLIVGGTLMETWRLREGGDVVAQMVGGRQVSPNTVNLRERRLLNVVEEMSLASGVTMPNVYVLDQEEHINAFAAGYSPNHAVVAVTRGTLERLNRDELQGVVAHEFSHILHGDIRLNIQLIGVVYGLILVALFGEKLLYLAGRSGGSRGRNGGGVLVILFAGLSLWVLGWIGVFFGRLIRAAISRQREFLADASAIQYTRNPDGIGAALRKIGGWSKTGSPDLGSQIQHPNAETLSHLFLGAARSSFADGWLATHPPLEERIARIYGRRMEMTAPNVLPEETTPDLPPLQYEATSQAAAFAVTQTHPLPGLLLPGALEQIGRPRQPQLHYAQQLNQPFPDLSVQREFTPEYRAWRALRQAAQEPYSACALVFSLLLAHDAAMREKQHALLKQAGAFAIEEALTLYSAAQDLPPALRLPLLDLTIPALRRLDERLRQQLLQHTQILIAADSKVALEEFVLETILQQRLQQNARAAVAVKYRHLAQLMPEIDTVLALVACSAENELKTEALQARMQHAATQLDLPGYAPLFRMPNFTQVKIALKKINALAPLQKPALIKAALTAAAQESGLSQRSSDLIHALCAALDSPLPPQVQMDGDINA